MEVTKSKQIVIYFKNGNMITIKDKEPFAITDNKTHMMFINNSYSYSFSNEAIAGVGYKLSSEDTEDADDGK